jgi:hypothetical protein
MYIAKAAESWLLPYSQFPCMATLSETWNIAKHGVMARWEAVAVTAVDV